MTRLPEYLLVLYALTGTLSIAASQAAMVAGALVVLLDRGRRTVVVRPRFELLAPLLAWVAASLLATAAASDPAASAGKLKKLALLAMVFWAPAVVTRRWSLGRLSMALLFGAGITSLYGLLTFFLHGGPHPDIRIRGFHGFYLTNAGMLLWCLFPALLFATQRRLGHSYRLAAGLTAVSVMAVLFFGRLPGVWLGMIAGLVHLAAVRRRGIALAALVALGLALVPAPDPVREAARDLVHAGSASNAERREVWSNGLALFRADPWTGCGLQDLRRDYERVAGPEARPQGHLQSLPVTVAAAMGVPGLLAFAWWMGATFVALRRARRSVSPGFERDLVEGVEAGLVGFLAAGLVDWNLGDSEILALLGFLVGLALAVPRVAGAAEAARGTGGGP